MIFQGVADPNFVVRFPFGLGAPHEVRAAILDTHNIRYFAGEFRDGIRSCQVTKGAVVKDNADVQGGARLSPPLFEALLLAILLLDFIC